jgi:uncharacterized membrane protein
VVVAAFFGVCFAFVVFVTSGFGFLVVVFAARFGGVAAAVSEFVCVDDERIADEGHEDAEGESGYKSGCESAFEVLKEHAYSSSTRQ